MRLFREPVKQRGPVLDAVVGDALQADVRGRAEQTLLQVLAEAVVDGERDNEGGDSRGHSQYGNCGDHTDEGLTAFGAQVTGGYE